MSKWTKIDSDTFTAERGRFTITADRTESGYIRGWQVIDAGTKTGPRGLAWHKNRVGVRHWITRRLSASLTEEQYARVEGEIKSLLHAHRDCLRNRGEDTSDIQFDARDGYYGEAFGVMRGLRLLGFGDWGPANVPGNLKSWFSDLCDQVLEEENFGGSNECDHCLEKWGKDGAGRCRGR